MNKGIVVLGCQWGDEGKGKIIDHLTPLIHGVVRFQGGHNAGHTLVVNNKKIILSLIPSGILHDSVVCYISQGVVVDPGHLLREIQRLEEQGVYVNDRLKLSSLCPVLLPTHQALDEARESKISNIGTTKRGIGPCYEDKIARRGIRIFELLSEKILTERLIPLIDYHNFLLKNYFDRPTFDFKEILEKYLQYGKMFTHRLIDVSKAIHTHWKQGEKVLFEGAQGFALDVDHGTYPYVTSSNTTVGGVLTGCGIAPQHITNVLGVVKAYTTRVGAGPFPTELTDEVGKHLAAKGHEFGSVTGRPRRCGWLDSVLLKRAIEINGVTALCLTKLDVLDELDEIKIATGYRLKTETNKLELESMELENQEPNYLTVKGWRERTRGIQTFEKLPKEARNYIEKIENLIEIPVSYISTGPERESTIVIKPVV